MNEHMFLNVQTSGMPFKGAKWNINYNEFPRILSACWYTDNYTYYIINQEGHKIPMSATIVHGLDNETTDRSNWKAPEVLLWLVDAAEHAKWIVGYNADFDASLIRANVFRVFGPNSDMGRSVIKAFDRDKRISVMHKLMAHAHGYSNIEDTYFRMFGERLPGHHAEGNVKMLRKIFDHSIQNGLIRVKNFQPHNHAEQK